MRRWGAGLLQSSFFDNFRKMSQQEHAFSRKHVETWSTVQILVVFRTPKTSENSKKSSLTYRCFFQFKKIIGGCRFLLQHQL